MNHLEDILGKYASPKNVDVGGTYYDFTFIQARQQIYKELMEIVGEDNPDNRLTGVNMYKAELRQAILEYTGVEK